MLETERPAVASASDDFELAHGEVNFGRAAPSVSFDQAYRRGGQAVLKPTFDCVAPNVDGTLTAFFGYENENGVSITVPYGTKNALPLDTQNQRLRSFLRRGAAGRPRPTRPSARSRAEPASAPPCAAEYEALNACFSQ